MYEVQLTLACLDIENTTGAEKIVLENHGAYGKQNAHSHGLTSWSMKMRHKIYHLHLLLAYIQDHHQSRIHFPKLLTRQNTPHTTPDLFQLG
jgi:hypothetical protein